MCWAHTRPAAAGTCGMHQPKGAPTLTNEKTESYMLCKKCKQQICIVYIIKNKDLVILVYIYIILNLWHDITLHSHIEGIRRDFTFMLVGHIGPTRTTHSSTKQGTVPWLLRHSPSPSARPSRKLPMCWAPSRIKHPMPCGLPSAWPQRPSSPGILAEIGLLWFKKSYSLKFKHVQLTSIDPNVQR